MKYKFILLPILCYCLSGSLSAQTPDEYIDKFFKEFLTQGAKTSIDNLYATNNWIGSDSDQIINLITQLSSLNEELVGKYRGKELIARKSIGESFVLISYMIKYDRQPIRFTFEFYKPADTWFIFYFKFDDSLDDELEKAAEMQEILKKKDN